jgi:hypothetical protein
MSRRLALSIAFIAALALTVGATPANATQYSIRGSKVFFSAANVFQLAQCPAAFVSSPANGSDSLVVDISGRANTAVGIGWNATVIPSQLGGGLQASFFSESCVLMPTANRGSGTTPGTWTLQVPAGAKWIAIESVNLIDVTLNF